MHVIIIIIGGFFILLMLAVFVSMILARRAGNKRRRKMEAVAHSLGMTFHPKANEAGVGLALDAFAFGQQGEIKGAQNIMTGQAGSFYSFLFDYIYSEKEDKSTRYHSQTMGVFKDASWAWPSQVWEGDSVNHPTLRAYLREGGYLETTSTQLLFGNVNSRVEADNLAALLQQGLELKDALRDELA